MLETHHSISRRRFLGATAGVGVLASQAAAKNLAPSTIGVELYTVRNMMPAEDAAVLHSIAQIGYKEVEGDYPTLMRIATQCKADGLSPISCHMPTDAILTTGKYEGPALEKIFADLKGIGTAYAVIPYIMPNLRKAEILDQFGEKANHAGELARQAGLQLCYHNHAFEWGQMDGKRVFDRMFGNTDPKLVKFEVDVFWLSVGGVNPVEFLKQHAGRVPLLHLKDKASGQAVQYNENVPHETFKEIGNGSLDFSAILREAKKIGVKHYFVEQDWTPGDPIASLKTSFQYLSGLHA